MRAVGVGVESDSIRNPQSAMRRVGGPAAALGEEVIEDVGLRDQVEAEAEDGGSFKFQVFSLKLGGAAVSGQRSAVRARRRCSVVDCTACRVDLIDEF